MSRKTINREVLAAVVAEQPQTFATKDISQDQRMLKAHPVHAQSRNYHAFVGGALSDHRVALGIDEVRAESARGSVWVRRFVPSRPAGASAELPDPVASTQDARSVGPQYRGDSRFAARVRLHQSWYRAHVLGVPFGTGPMPTSQSSLGNMLTRADGEAGLNFLTPEIAEVARVRVASGVGTVESFRLFHNMLSSQPMCFNLFGPMVNNKVLARQLLATLVPEEVAEVTFAALEYAPTPANEYLGDRTAFDAFLEYRAADGQLYGLGIETKLTEPFSQKVYDTERYRRWMNVPGHPWRPGADPHVQEIAHNQLWRDHLLAVAMRFHAKSKYAKVRLLVLHHPQDPGCTSVIAGYRRLLRADDDTVFDLTLDRLHAAWATALQDSTHAKWLSDFGVRYLDLDRSRDSVPR